MTRFLARFLSHSWLWVLLGLLLGGSLSRAQAPAAAMFAGTAEAPPSSAPPATTSPDLPNAPLAKPAMVRAAGPAGEQPLVLPRHFQIAFGSSRTDVPGKVSYYLSSTWSVRNLLEAMAVAGVPELTGAPHQPVLGSQTVQVYDSELDAYGDAMKNWLHVNERMLRYHADRFEVGLAAAETRDLFSNLVLPLALHQEARYIPAPVNSDLSGRMWYAVESIVVTRNDAGSLVPNYSKLGGTVGAAFVAKELYANAFKAPELDSGHFVARYIGYSLLGDLGTNVAHELVRAAVEPDMTMYNLHERATDDAYYPLSIGGKFIYWARSTYAVRNFVSAALIGDLPPIPTQPTQPENGLPSTYNGFPNYPVAYENYGTSLLLWKDTIESGVRTHLRRFGGGLAESETQAFVQNLAVPVLFNMDPRYVPLGPGYSGSQRFAHAFEGLVVTHTDAGARTVNVPLLAGTFGAAYAAKEIYYPQLGLPALETNSVLARTITLNLAADALYNVIGEFLRHRGY